jgi:cyanophycin synthetase
VGEARVLVDYAHNPAALEGLMDLAMALPAKQRIATIAAPGDRRDEDIRTLGRLCARMDRVIVKEDDDRRGRAAGEVAGLVIEGLIAGGMREDRIETIASEREAVECLLRNLGDGDLGVVLADKVPAVLAQIQPHTSTGAP